MAITFETVGNKIAGVLPLGPKIEFETGKEVRLWEHVYLDDDYRIRLASLTLLGDLLSTIGGTTLLIGDGDTRDDIRRAERAQAQIALVLGNEKRKRVLSGLYLARSDNTSVVRHHAIQVWKTVVAVTARTLKDILPVLVGQVVPPTCESHEC